MPVKITGMIGTQQEGIAVHLIKGKISREWVIDFTRLHEQWDYDFVLVGYYASAAEGFGIALYAADHTERIKFLIAHRPGSVAPALAARQIATFDQLTQGRMSLHVIAGTSDQDQASEGDFLPKNDRYRRAGEYLEVMRKMWTSDSPFNHRGEFYRVEGAYSDIKPISSRTPGCSLAARRKARCRWAPNIATCSRSSANRLRRRKPGSTIFAAAPLHSDAVPISTCRYAPSWRITRVRPGTKPSACWPTSSGKTGAAPQPSNHSSERLLSYAERADVHDERLWMGIARATGAPGNTSCLVGTPEQVAAAVLKYYRLGIPSFLLRGFENPQDTVAIGRDLIPLIRAGAAEIDRQAQAAE